MSASRYVVVPNPERVMVSDRIRCFLLVFILAVPLSLAHLSQVALELIQSCGEWPEQRPGVQSVNLMRRFVGDQCSRGSGRSYHRLATTRHWSLIGGLWSLISILRAPRVVCLWSPVRQSLCSRSPSDQLAASTCRRHQSLLKHQRMPPSAAVTPRRAGAVPVSSLGLSAAPAGRQPTHPAASTTRRAPPVPTNRTARCRIINHSRPVASSRLS